MDRIQALKTRKETLKAAGKEIRAKIAALTDEDSFVELSAFSFSKDEFYGEDAQGEGVVTGFATVGGYPFYIVAQNFAVCSGGLSKANCDKICKTLDAAERSATPVVYLLHSHGVRIGEGVNVLEGIASLLMRAEQLKGSVLQFAVLDGEVYGSSAVLASLADVVLFVGGAVLAATSPLVLSAKAGKNLKPVEVGGYDAVQAVLPAVHVADMREAAAKILAVSDLVRIPVLDAELNAPAPALNRSADAAAIVKLIENAVELGANSVPEVKTLLGRVGGIAVAAAVFDRASVSEAVLKKLKAFAEFASCYSLPLVHFVDAAGLEPTMRNEASGTLKEIGEYLAMLDTVEGKIAVVTGKAVGLGYALFAAKSAGFDYTYALATAHIALFDSVQGAEIEFSPADGDRDRLAARYSEENADPFNAAKGGYLDDIIEPQFLPQYLTAALQTLQK